MDITNLPEDILLSIYKELHLLDASTFSGVNKRLFNIFKDNKEYIIKNVEYQVIDLYNDNIMYSVRRTDYTDKDIDELIKKNNRIKFIMYKNNFYDFSKYTKYISKINLNFMNHDQVYPTLCKLTNINSLSLLGSNVADISIMSNIYIKVLNLSKCKYIFNLPEFKCLDEINLSECSNFNFNNNNLLKLKNVKTINFSYCTSKVKIDDDIDLSILENVTDLDISNCTNLKSDITVLKKLIKLNIYNCDNIIYTFTFLNNLNSLTVDCVFNNNNKLLLKKQNIKIKHGCMTHSKRYCFICNSSI